MNTTLDMLRNTGKCAGRTTKKKAPRKAGLQCISSRDD